MTAGLQEYIAAFATTPRLEIGQLTQLMKTRGRYLPRSAGLEIAARLAAAVPGSIVEFGVASGDSTRLLRKISNKKIFALDSFNGLPEAFENAAVGQFAQPGVPDIPDVTFVVGYFQDTCTEELAEAVKQVAFAHLDADLYSSTVVALRWLTPLLVNGALLLFDEFTGENNAEARALSDWQMESGTAVIRIAEFDREPSGWGDIPDKRVLFQVIRENPDTGGKKWTASAPTFIKATLTRAADLSNAEKRTVQSGDVLTFGRSERTGDHQKIFGVSLNGQSFPEEGWFIFPSHWKAS